MSSARVSHAGVRHPAVAGLFYPGSPSQLRKDLENFFKEAKPAPRAGTVRGVIAPHAGYLYSGFTAASSYARLAGSTYDSVVIVSPSHREAFEGVSVYPGSAYETPLGTVPIDESLRDHLLNVCPLVRATEAGHRSEHAVEVHLPFLQQVLPAFRLLPLVMGDQSRDVCRGLAKGLSEVLKGRNVLLVASTDLSHYYPSAVADRLDEVVIEDLRRFDEERLMDDLEAGKAEACGGGPTVAVMAALRALGATRVEVVHHCNSGNITGDSASVVGYVSAVAYA